CWQEEWVAEVDRKGAFEKLDPERLRKAGRTHTACRWIRLSVERGLQAPTVSAAGEVRARQRGTPQGGVRGPRWLNLLLPSALDRWRRRELPTSPFAR